MIHRRTLSNNSLGTLQERIRATKVSVSQIPTGHCLGVTLHFLKKHMYISTHSVIEVFPMGALARKSLAMGFTQRINTMTGDRKLICSRILWEILGTPLRERNTANGFFLISIKRHGEQFSAGWIHGVLLDEWSAWVHLYSIKMSLSHSQAGESQQSTDVSTDSGETQLHCQLRHWDSGVRTTNS